MIRSTSCARFSRRRRSTSIGSPPTSATDFPGRRVEDIRACTIARARAITPLTHGPAARFEQPPSDVVPPSLLAGEEAGINLVQLREALSKEGAEIALEERR